MKNPGKTPAPIGRNQIALYLIFAVINLLLFPLIWSSRRPIDYQAFYAVGRLADSSLAGVYDGTAQRTMFGRFHPIEGWVPFYHLPHELLIFGPLAKLPYGFSFALWTALGLGFLLAGTKLLAITLRAEWPLVLLLSCALFGTGFSFYEGQDTMLLVCLLAAALCLLDRGQDSGAAVILALALFKPQIPLVVALALVLGGRVRFFAVFLASAAAIAAASYYAIGSSGLHQALALMKTYEPQEQAWRMLSLRALLSLLHAPYAASIAAAAALVVVFALRWWRAQNLAMVFASAVVVGSLSAFHFHAYDAAVMIFPLACMALLLKMDWAGYVVAVSLCLSPLFFALSTINMTALLAIPLLLLAAKLWIELGKKPAPVLGSSCAGGAI